jgi:hypothetical protein
MTGVAALQVLVRQVLVDIQEHLYTRPLAQEDTSFVSQRMWLIAK